MYRDLKPENVLLDADGNCKLSDFGLSKVLDEKSDLTQTFCGTMHYMAPEVCGESGYDRMSDWWSLGILLF